MTPGKVMIHDDFLFHDGNRATKLFIILGCKNDRFLVAKTTSQKTSKSSTTGCNSSDRFHNFFIKSGTGFKKDTWICLHEFYEFSSAELTQLKNSGTIRNICQMSKSVLADINTCAKVSEDISSDQIDIIA